MEVLKDAAAKIGGEMVLDEEALNLDKTNPEFASLMNDYKNGIYIFKLQEDEVWNKINLDSNRVYQYYLDNKDKYSWGERVNFSEIYSRQDSLINLYYSMLQEGDNFDSLAAKYTEKAGMKNKAGSYGLVEVKSSPYSELAGKADSLQNPGDYTKPFANAGGYSIVKLNSKEPPTLKTFEEAKAEVSGAFQEAESKRLEQGYIDGLKKLYHPELYYDKLQQAFKDENTEGNSSQSITKTE